MTIEQLQARANAAPQYLMPQRPTAAEVRRLYEAVLRRDPPDREVDEHEANEHGKGES